MITDTAQALTLDGPIVETGRVPHTDLTWETRDAGTIKIAGSEYAVTIQTFSNGMEPDVRLTGPRGGVYFLRGFLGSDTGARQVIRYQGGKPLRVKGHEVRAFLVGDLLSITYLR